MASETPAGHFQYPDLHDLRWYKNGEDIEIDGTVRTQGHDGIVDWLEQLEIRLTGVVERFDNLPQPDEDEVDPRTGNERIYLVRNRESFYRDTGSQWVVTGGDEGDAVGAGFGLELGTLYEVDQTEDFTWTGTHTFDDDSVAFTIGDQGVEPTQPGEVARDGNDVYLHTGAGLVNLSSGGDGGGSGGSDVISSPNLNMPYTELADSQRIGYPVSVGDSEIIEVRSWGVSDTDGNTPSGLFVELVDEGGSVVQNANTEWNSAPAGVASWENTSGTRATVTLGVNNTTGSDYTDPDGVGANFGYVVE